ncbi:MAG: nicotianamine synthase family protein [Candidatus Saccharibacteria bacterium]|nr:nicotianamine synthase family protein [Candidatus Saccharibacteria bacterium]
MKEAVMNVMALPDVVPSPAVNAAFSDLVASVVRRQTLPTWCDAAMCRGVQCRCAESEAAMETYWARRIIAADDPQYELAQFWYLANYRELVRREIGLLDVASVRLTDQSRVAFIGSGPLPLTALELWRMTGAQVDLIDIAHEAVALSTDLARVLRWPMRAMVGDGATIALPAEAYDVIYVAGLAGGHGAHKQRIIDNVLPSLMPDGRLVVRAAVGARTLLYPAFTPEDGAGMRLMMAYHPQDEVINSVYVYSKGEHE